MDRDQINQELQEVNLNLKNITNIVNELNAPFIEDYDIDHLLEQAESAIAKLEIILQKI